MEGASIAHGAYLNGIPFVIIRAISDKADDSAEMDYPTFENGRSTPFRQAGRGYDAPDLIRAAVLRIENCRHNACFTDFANAIEKMHINMKKKEKKYIEYILKQAEALLAIDSPSGFTEKVTDYLCEEYKRLGYKPVKTKKGGVLVEIGGKDNAVLTMAHVDTLGGMVAEIKSNGRLRLTKVGGLNANNIETENCRIYTLDGKVYEGTVQLTDASIHVNGDYQKSERTFDSVEVLLDEKVSSKEEVKALGIENGSFVCMDPRTRITESGYIKSRFLDDKLSTAILLGFAKYVKDEDLKLSRKVYQHITVFEEVGHGACASAPEDVEELLSVDMGCVGEGLECTDRQVSICVKDGHGPYHYDVVKGLIQAAKDNHIDYAADVYPYYGSDADAALSAGIDARHGLIGPGVYASHGL